MNILIVGCGKMGSKLAAELNRQGHDVSVIAKNASQFDVLPNDFQGYTISGVPIDIDVLKQAGIEGCDAVAAVTEDDNINIMICQIAKEMFQVTTVIARLFDPSRQDVFSHLGIQTICPTNITVDSVRAAITNTISSEFITFGTGTVSFSTSLPTRQQVGQRSAELQTQNKEIVFALIHKNGEVELVNRFNNPEILPTDKLIHAKVVD